MCAGHGCGDSRPEVQETQEEAGEYLLALYALNVLT